MSGGRLTYWRRLDPHRVATEASHRHIQSVLEQAQADVELLMDALHQALPYVEDARADTCLKPGTAARTEAFIRSAIKTVERL